MSDSYDDMVGLSGYFAEFVSDRMPSSLGVAVPAPTLEKRKPYVPILEKAGVRYVSTPVRTVQTYLNLLQADAGNSGRLDAKTKAAFAKWAKLFKEGRQTTLSAVRMEDINSLERTLAKRIKANTAFTHMHPDVLSRLKALASKAAAAGAKAPAPKTAAAAPTLVASGADMTASTDDIQGILKRLGAPKERLSDGLFGTTTKGFWREAAKKRGKNPTIIAKPGARLKQVSVNTSAYLAIKADADAKRPPAPGAQAAEPIGGTLRTMDQALVRGVTKEELTILLDRLVGPGPILTQWEKAAKAAGVDPRIEADGDRYLVLKASLETLTKAFLAKAPPPPPPGPTRDNMEAAMATIVKQATTSVPIATVRTALNAAIQAGTLKLPLFKGGWEQTMAAPLVAMSKPADAVWKAAWEQSFVPGKLVSGTSVKLLPSVATAITALAARYKKVVVAAKDRFLGYTKVNAAEVIARINGLGVTTQKFDRAGGAKELADAIKTFLTESKSSIPGGDLVRTDAQKNTYVKNGVMQSLATAVAAAQARSSKTQTFRSRMVANAIKESSATLPITSVQQAIKHLVLSKRAGKNVALYSKVAITGAFDAPTRAVFTEIARTRTIGPAVQSYQALLQQQLGPAFKSALVIEARNQVWNSLLDAVVKKRDGKLSVAMLPPIATALASGAALYHQNVAADQRHAEESAAQERALAAALKRSTAIASLVLVQQGLKQMLATKEIDPVAGLSITGFSDKATNAGLHETAGMIFPEGYVVPETIWAKYLRAAGYVVVSGQPPKRAWLRANYISLPPALADLLAKRAGEWITKNGSAAIKVVRFDNPSVVTVKMPPPKKVVISEKEAAKKVVESPAPAAKSGASEQEAALKAARADAERERKTRELVEKQAAAARKAAELAAEKARAERAAAVAAAAAAANAKQVEHEARLAEQAAKSAGDIRKAEQAAAQAAQAAAMAASAAAETRAAQARAAEAGREQQAAEAQAGGAKVTGPSITGPTITIQAPTPVAEAGMSGKTIAMMVGAAISLAALLKDSGGSSGAA